MRFAILGDIHANLHALNAVLADAAEQKATHHICMGDIVGYNAFPKECVNIIRELDCPTVKGNHDEQASKEFPQEGLNPLAEEALGWTRRQLEPADVQWLRELRMQRLVRDFTIVHATLDTPHKWGYVNTELDAAANFSYQHTGLCFIGHTHVPVAYTKDGISGPSRSTFSPSTATRNISSTWEAWANRAMPTGGRPIASTIPHSRKSNCVAWNTT